MTHRLIDASPRAAVCHAVEQVSSLLPAWSGGQGGGAELRKVVFRSYANPLSAA